MREVSFLASMRDIGEISEILLLMGGIINEPGFKLNMLDRCVNQILKKEGYDEIVKEAKINSLNKIAETIPYYIDLDVFESIVKGEVINYSDITIKFNGTYTCAEEIKMAMSLAMESFINTVTKKLFEKATYNIKYYSLYFNK